MRYVWGVITMNAGNEGACYTAPSQQLLGLSANVHSFAGQCSRRSLPPSLSPPPTPRLG